MNKINKIWVNNIAGAGISVILLWYIYIKITEQASKIDIHIFSHTGSAFYLSACVLFMFLNLGLECLKWNILANYVSPEKLERIVASYLSGLAFSIITPNRLGEYPARIFYLGKGQTLRYINVAVFGVLAQLFTVFAFGLAGLSYYLLRFPSITSQLATLLCAVGCVLLIIVYIKHQSWLPGLSKYKFANRFILYGKLLKKISTNRRFTILGITILRYLIYSAQYLFLLRWMNIDIPWMDGFCLVTLFFWILSVVPSLALGELGVRTGLGWYLFHSFTNNTAGIVVATAGIWLLNIILPAIVGSLLIFRMKIIR